MADSSYNSLPTNDFDLIIPELNRIRIRRTEDGRASVLDLLRAVGAGKSSAKMTWQRIQEKYPDVVTDCDSIKFPDSKGRKINATPVVDLEGWLKILSVVPGAMGASYREKAANLVCRYLKGDPELALDILYRKGNEQNFERARKRILVKETNKSTAKLAHEQGHSVGAVHNDRYRGLYQKTCKQLHSEASETLGIELKETETPLDYMSQYDLGLNWLANIQAEMAGNATAMTDIARTIREQHEKVFKQELKPTWESKMGRLEAAEVTNGQLGLPVS